MSLDLVTLGGFDPIELAGGLHWYCAEYHGGQASGLYSMMCRVQYRPGAFETGPTYEAKNVYDALVSGDIDPEDVLARLVEAP